MTYSEFCRRVKENGSNGSDHGTANAQFLLGGAVKGGIYGDKNKKEFHLFIFILFITMSSFYLTKFIFCTSFILF